ncbi:MAG: FMN-bind domain-containing protein [Burkholderia sp.]|jgi:fumarate reductase flavoprotein subunit
MDKQYSRRAFLRTGLAGSAAIAAAAVHAAPAGIYKPGTYSAKAAGIGGDVVVTMTFDENKITDVVIDASSETPGIGQAAAPKLKEALLKMQTSEVDTVSGASVTSSAVRKAAAKCIQQAKGEIPVEVITKKTESADAGSEGGKENLDWLGKEPVIDEKDIVSTVDTDILVVGCGTGGMFAVASAAEAGGKVIGIDRFAVGTGIRDDLGAIDSRYQKKWGTKIDKFEYIAMATTYAAGHLEQDLVKLFCDNSGAVIDWYGDRLAERGVELWHESGDKNDVTRFKHFPTGHSPRWRGTNDGTGKPLNGDKILRDYALKHGARFDYNMKMVKLEKKNGRVTGVIAENGDGKYVRYNARKGVVVATGGYARNYKMLNALQPWNLRIVGISSAMPGALGDGIRACLWAGAKMDETHSMMMFDRCAIRPDQHPGIDTIKSGDSGMFWMGSQPWLKVNADGKRFMNESGTYENVLHADEYNKGHVHYTLFDSNWVQYAKQFKMHGCSRLFPFENGADPNVPWQVMKNKMLPGLLEKGYVQKADTIEELAKKLGLQPDALKATVDRYNKLVYAGNDTDYGKEKHRLSPLDKPPFYGAKTTGRVLCTMDGIQINTHMNAIDTEGNPIPGLYVIGNDSGGYFANEYPNLSTGMACGRTVTFGRLVGLELAKAKA